MNQHLCALIKSLPPSTHTFKVFFSLWGILVVRWRKPSKYISHMTVLSPEIMHRHWTNDYSKLTREAKNCLKDKLHSATKFGLIFWSVKWTKSSKKTNSYYADYNHNSPNTSQPCTDHISKSFCVLTSTICGQCHNCSFYDRLLYSEIKNINIYPDFWRSWQKALRNIPNFIW